MLPPFTNMFFPSIINKKLRACSDSFYPLLWNYFTIPAPVNILISTAINLAFQLGAAALYSTALLQLIMPYFNGIAFLTLTGHIIAFLFYKKHQNQKMAQALNRLKPQS
ncbi:hypothetical protein [Bacillus sp. MZGC1]|uniref:hypothetical protein n=1 Tax=unclassified Bacillus (in: firmicutes) TaxID=185979 RepID=UPI001CB8E4BD|nr:hypothetical protein [Bacillus sp. MZGC1]